MSIVTLANRNGATYEVDPRRSLLDSLRDLGVDLPYIAIKSA